jgi:hypothetical protein
LDRDVVDLVQLSIEHGLERLSSERAFHKRGASLQRSREAKLFKGE